MEAVRGRRFLRHLFRSRRMETPRQRSHHNHGGPMLHPSFSDLSDKSPNDTSRAGKRVKH
eukprot:1339375-Pyramimonas_sp.AAC.1